MRHQVGIGKNRRNDIRKTSVWGKIPEDIQDFDVASPVGAHPRCRDQLGNGSAGVYCEVRGPEILRQFLGGWFTSPVCVLLCEIGFLKAFGVGLESPRIKFRAQRDGIVGDPFFEQTFWIEQFPILLRLEAQQSSGFEVLHDGAYGAEGHAGPRRDLPIVCANQVRAAQQCEAYLEAGRIQGAETILAKSGGPSLARNVDEQSRPFEIGVAGGIDEGQMELGSVRQPRA